jgi:hypothetical protein
VENNHIQNLKIATGKIPAFDACGKKGLHVVAYLLEARTVEPEKQPLLVNSSETTFISRQQP